VVLTLDHFSDQDATDNDVNVTPERESVIETDPQQTISGGRASPQARIAGAEQGEVDSEVEQASTTEQNPGGIMADEREDTSNDGSTGDGTEQQIPDEFQVAEGGQDTL
jgi:hypothetical protein